MIKWKWCIVEGVLLFVLGILAISHPQEATLTIVDLLGWLLLVLGCFALLGGITAQAGPRVPPALAGGVIACICGLLLLLLPGVAIATTTIVVAIFFLLSGLIEVFSSFALRSTGGHANHWGLAFFNGFISIIFGIVLLTYCPLPEILGLLFGINMLCCSAYAISLGWFFRNAPAH